MGFYNFVGLRKELYDEVNKFNKSMTIDDSGEKDERRRIPKIGQRPHYPPKNLEYNNNQYVKSQDSILAINEQIKANQRLLDLQNKLGVNIVQKNGQRRLGPPPNRTGPPPSKGCEIFVGRIPRNIFEDVIYPLFSQVGQIYELRLMMNFSGTNRGFCFIMYEKPEMAQKAIELLDGYSIQPGWLIGVVESVNNCRLHLTHLPPEKSAKSIIEIIRQICEEVDSISVFTNINNSKIKHALVTFKTHRGAAMARRRLLPERNNLFDKQEVRIEWAHPKISVKNVIEEKGSWDENGVFQLCTKDIKIDRRTFCEENASKSFFKYSPKNKFDANTFKLYNSYTMKNDSKELNHNKTKTKVNDLNKDHKNYNYILKNNKRINCSERSDESVSNFSINSDADELKNVPYHQNCTGFYYNLVPFYFNARNCSNINYPWHNSQPAQKFYPIFNSTPFPWKQLDLQNNNIPVTEQTNFIEFQEKSYNNLVFKNNHTDIKGLETKSYQPVQDVYNYRPILNRNFLTN